MMRKIIKDIKHSHWFLFTCLCCNPSKGVSIFLVAISLLFETVDWFGYGRSGSSNYANPMFDHRRQRDGSEFKTFFILVIGRGGG